MVAHFGKLNLPICQLQAHCAPCLLAITELGALCLDQCIDTQIAHRNASTLYLTTKVAYLRCHCLCWRYAPSFNWPTRRECFSQPSKWANCVHSFLFKFFPFYRHYLDMGIVHHCDSNYFIKFTLLPLAMSPSKSPNYYALGWQSGASLTKLIIVPLD